MDSGPIERTVSASALIGRTVNAPGTIRGTVSVTSQKLCGIGSSLSVLSSNPVVVYLGDGLNLSLGLISLPSIWGSISDLHPHRKLLGQFLRFEEMVFTILPPVLEVL